MVVYPGLKRLDSFRICLERLGLQRTDQFLHHHHRVLGGFDLRHLDIGSSVFSVLTNFFTITIVSSAALTCATSTLVARSSIFLKSSRIARNCSFTSSTFP